MPTKRFGIMGDRGRGRRGRERERRWTGLLMVFMDDTDDDEGNKEDPEVRRMDQFFFSVDDAPLLLSSFSFGDLAFVDAKEQYAVE